MTNAIYCATKWFYTIIASLMIGIVANLVLFFGSIFLFAGAEGGSWVRWCFEAGNGELFMAVTLLLAFPTIPYTRKLNIVSK